MIINAALRTDIPAFYSKWFFNRLKSGFVMVRSPYAQHIVYRYNLSPKVVDLFSFCTKNPLPMLGNLHLLKDYGQYWFITITPYGKDIEPNVPDKKDIISGFCELSAKLGKNCVGWRYDPIFLTKDYDISFHKAAFEKIACALSGATDIYVISFVNIYDKVKKNFPEAKAVSLEEKLDLGEFLVKTAAKYGMKLKPCVSGLELGRFGADLSGCATKQTFEKVLGENLNMPPKQMGREKKCHCYISCDIGAYNTCGHLCRYCYANYDSKTVLENIKKHNPASPLILGSVDSKDIIRNVAQYSWRSKQVTFF